jgi:hypothetical protein
LPTLTASSSAPFPPLTPTKPPASKIPLPQTTLKLNWPLPRRTSKKPAQPPLILRARPPGVPPSPNPTPPRNLHDPRHPPQLHP